MQVKACDVEVLPEHPAKSNMYHSEEFLCYSNSPFPFVQPTMAFQCKQKFAESRVLIKFIKGEWGIYDVPLCVKLHCLPEDIDNYRVWDIEKAMNKVIDTYTRADLVNFVETMEISLPSSSSNSKPKKKAIAEAIINKCMVPQSFSPNAPPEQQVPWSELLVNDDDKVLCDFLEEKFGEGAFQRFSDYRRSLCSELLEKAGINSSEDAKRMIHLLIDFKAKEHTKSENKRMMRSTEALR